MEPPTFDLGDVIAERRMQFVAQAGWSREVTIRVGRPVRDGRSGRAWVCPFQIEGLDSDAVKGIFGSDSMQALLLSIHTIPGELSGYMRHTPGAFKHLGETDSSFIDPCRTVLQYGDDMFPRPED